MIVPISPILLVGGFSSALIAAFCWQLIKARRSREIEWSELVFRLRPADRPALGKLASGYLNPAEVDDGDAQDPLAQLGGIGALNAIYENSKVILALAGYVTRWNLEEGTAVTATIRRDAILLQKTITRIRVEVYGRRLLRIVPFRNPDLRHHLQKVALLYQQMSEHLLDLYRNNHAGLYPQLSVVMRLC